MSTPSIPPDQNTYRNVVEYCLRHFAAYLMEAHMTREHAEQLEGQFRRGQEGSLFDAGVIVRQGSDGAYDLLGLEAKTLVVKYRQPANINTIRGPSWIGKIEYNEAQLGCGVWLIFFPFLRHARVWRAIQNPRAAGFAPSDGQEEVTYWHAAAGQRIDHVVPSSLWPSVGDLSNSLSVIAALSAGGQGTTVARPAEDFTFDFSERNLSFCTTGALQNPFYPRECELVELIRKEFANLPQPEFEVVDPVYSPYTADFAFVHVESGITAFVEIKVGLCEIEESPGDLNSVVVRHHHANPHKKSPFFTFSGGRWTYFISTIGTNSMTSDGGISLPPNALILHRDDIPKDWWYSEPKPGEKLLAVTARSSIIDLREHLAPQIQTLLRADLRRSRFGLPRLEAFAGVPQDRLSRLYRRAAHQASRNVIRPDKSSKASRSNYKYQADEAIRFFHSCHDLGQGLLFDWQHKHVGLRTYAFCPYTWSAFDMEYTSRYPRRPPVQIFELPTDQDYIILSFCLVRQGEAEDEIYLHPFVLKDLYQDIGSGAAFPAPQRILLMMAEDLVQCRTMPSPLYVVPVAALRLDQPLPRSWSRWVKAKFRDQTYFEHFRFDDREAVIEYFAKRSSQMVAGGDESGKMALVNYRICPTSRRELYTKIRLLTTRNAEEVESDDEDVEDDIVKDLSTEQELNQDWMLF